MNVGLLRLARRHGNGVRSWVVPGFTNGVRLVPSSLTMWPGAAAVRWPARDPSGEVQRSVRLDWHRALAKRELRALYDPPADP